jgi:hypothetical protein
MVNTFSTQPTRPKKRHTGWLQSIRHNGHYVRHVAIATLLMGASAHLAVVALGRRSHTSSRLRSSYCSRCSWPTSA